MKMTILIIVLKEVNERMEEFDEGIYELIPVYQLEGFLKDSDRDWKIERYYFKEFSDDNVEEMQVEIEELQSKLDNISTYLSDVEHFINNALEWVDEANDECIY